MASISVQLRAELLAYDHLRLFFEQPVAVTETVSDPSAYTITAITANANTIEVVDIRGVDISGEELITYLDLRISRATIDAVYQIEVTGLKSANQDTFITNDNNGMVAKFLGRKTKTDTWSSSMARMYDLSIDSTMRGIIAAMALEDERIGGRGDLAPIPLVDVSELSTYGSATYGTSTYGG